MQVGISSFGAWMLGVSANIGSMAFLFHAPMIALGGPLASVTAWALAALLSLPLALVLAELASMFPAAGGPYVYKYVALKRLIPGMGEMLGFLTGWIFWIYLVVGYACMSCGLANLLGTSIWGGAQASPFWFGPVVITLLFATTTWLNLMQVRHAARLNSVFTLLKLAVALAFGVLVACSPGASLVNMMQPASPAGSSNFIANVAAVLPFALAGFSGIEMAGCAASETSDARRSVPRAILRTVATVAVVYVGMCIAVSCASPYTLSNDGSAAVVATSGTVATAPALAGLIGGRLWGAAITAGVVLSITSCAFSGLLSAARTSFSMAETGLFPGQFARLNPRTRVPQYSLVFQFVFLTVIGVGANLLSRSGAFADAYTFLGGACGFIYAVLAMLYGVCLVGLRYTDPQLPRPFRLGRSGNRLAWQLALGSAAVYAVIAFACTHWTYQLAGLAFLVLGVPVYAFYRCR
jgi:APA family basic amino acid/polyamine antiporter